MSTGDPSGRFSSIRSLMYMELNQYWVKGKRNGRLRFLSDVERGFYGACMLFARLKGAITSPKLISMLSVIIEKLKPLRIKALEVGRRRAEELKALFKRSGVFKWAPRIREWLRDESYVLYLGFMEIYTPPRFAW